MFNNTENNLQKFDNFNIYNIDIPDDYLKNIISEIFGNKENIEFKDLAKINNLEIENINNEEFEIYCNFFENLVNLKCLKFKDCNLGNKI